jgi:hypothetical protein
MSTRSNSTHRVAALLEQLAKLLRSGPDIPLTETRISERDTQDELELKGIAVNLSTLASLSKLKKESWVKFISHYRLPVEIKKSDSVRDLVGRLLTFLEKDEGARERLSRAASSDDEVSSELTRTLQMLLRPR